MPRAMTTNCDDPRCNWSITTTSPVKAGIARANHVVSDPRHTGDHWVDRKGNHRIGFDLAPQKEDDASTPEV